MPPDERMDIGAMHLALDVDKRLGAQQFDLTDGSPEMDPHIRWPFEAKDSFASWREF